MKAIVLGSLPTDLIDGARTLFGEIKVHADIASAVNAADDSDATVALASGKFPIGTELLRAFPSLKMIANYGVGYDHADLAALRAGRVTFTNTPGRLSAAVAETAMLLMLNLARRGTEADRFVREGRWARETFPLTGGLDGKKIGIVGLGRIGREILNRALAFGMKAFYQGPHEKKDVAATYIRDLTDLAREVDYLVLALPGGPEMKHLVDAKILEALGPEGFLVNIARGTIIDEAALVTALREKRVAGAGLDVFEHEPHVPSELRELPNVVLTPHYASGTVDARRAMTEQVLENLRAWKEGDPPPDRVV